MKQKKSQLIKSKNILFSGAVFLVFIFTGSTICAQEMIPVRADDIGSDTVSGMPMENMMNSLSSGGLSSFQNIQALKSNADEVQAGGTVVQTEIKNPSNATQTLDPASLQNLEIQGGLSTKAQIDPDTPSVFKLAAKFFEKVVFEKVVKF